MIDLDSDINMSFSFNKNEAHNIFSTSDPNISSSINKLPQSSFKKEKELQKRLKKETSKRTPLYKKIWSCCTLKPLYFGQYNFLFSLNSKNTVIKEEMLPLGDSVTS